MAGVLDTGLEVAARLLAARGETLDDRDAEHLLTYATDLEDAGDPVHARVGRIFAAALAGFFHLAANGERLESPRHLGDGFDDSIDETYPGAGQEFRRLAVSYWTLRMLEARVTERSSGILLQQLLRHVVERVEAAFFQEPGERHDADALARMQRKLLAEAEAPIDVEALLHANPLLIGNPLA